MASVEVGLYDDENAQILSGVNADDMVVSTWSNNLYEGADIRLKDDAADSTAADSQNAEAPANAEGENSQEAKDAASADKDSQNGAPKAQ